MKRSDFIQHLWNMAAFYYVKEQSIRFGRTKLIANEPTVPRHRELVDFTVIRICQQLEIPSPFEKK